MRKLAVPFVALCAVLSAALLWTRKPVYAAPTPCADCPRPAAAPPEDVEAGHERLGAPQPGDWRASFKEAAQSFDAYAASDVNRACKHRTTIYIQALDSRAGRLGFGPKCEKEYPKVVERMAEYLGAFYGVPVKTLPPIAMLEEAYVKDRDQYDADALTNLLAAKVPADALAYVGLTREDLFSPGLNFVFGVGSLSQRAGAYSMRRLQTDDPTLFLSRGLKLVVHEVGHILSIHHCVRWRCVMQGANSASEQDGQPLRLCPDDLRKVEWNTGVGRKARTAALLRLNRAYGFKDEAAWLEKR